MATPEEVQLQFAQQQQSLQQARQSSLAARQQLSLIPSAERPSTSQLMQRGMTERIQAQEAQRQTGVYKQTEAQRIKAYEAQVSEAETQLASEQMAFEKAMQPYRESVQQQEEFERGRQLAFDKTPYASFMITSSAMREGYKYGKAEKSHAKAKGEYLQYLKTPEAAMPKELPKEEFRFVGSPIRVPFGYIQEMPKAVTIAEPAQPMYYKSGGVLTTKKPFSLFGQLDIAVEKISSYTTSKLPEGKLKEYAKAPSPFTFSIGQAAQWAFFSPLFSSIAAKKGTKQVTVEEKAEAAKKTLTKTEAKEVIKYYSDTPERQRYFIEKTLETIKDPERLKEIKKLFDQSLGKTASSTLWKDVMEQQGYAKQTFLPKPIKIKPVAEFEVKIEPSVSKYYGRPEYSFALTQMGGLGKGMLLPTQNVWTAGALVGIQMIKPVAIPKSAFGLGLKSELGQKGIVLQKPMLGLKPMTKTAQISFQSTALTSMSKFDLAQMPKQELALRTTQKQIPSKELGFGMPIWQKISPSVTLKAKEKFGIKKRKAYRTFVKRKGQYKAFGLPMPKGKAIKFGERIAATTLARSFKVVPTKRELTGYDLESEYQPSKIFRSYKIQKGKRIPLQDEWIQRRKFSLAAMGERREIKAARKKIKIW